ncbi:MAG: GP88 family protein [Promethearchaeota archaeon]
MSFGNTKLPNTTGIFNLCSAHACPAAKLGLCQLKNVKKCYALQAEIQYPDCEPYRNRQAAFWKYTNAKNFTLQFNAMNEKKRIKLDKIRFDESGDFENQSDVNKMIEIANNLKVTVYTYTARKDLDFKDRGKLHINGSGFMIDNAFIACRYPWLKKAALKAKGYKKVIYCPMNCKNCHICSNYKGYYIICKKH